jgi:hypothetical protein
MTRTKRQPKCPDEFHEVRLDACLMLAPANEVGRQGVLTATLIAARQGVTP